jgi:hypothetical protein
MMTATIYDINAGGNFPNTQMFYANPNNPCDRYFAPGLGTPINSLSYSQQALLYAGQALSYAGQTISNTASTASQATVNSMSATVSRISYIIDSLKSK